MLAKPVPLLRAVHQNKRALLIKIVSLCTVCVLGLLVDVRARTGKHRSEKTGEEITTTSQTPLGLELIDLLQQILRELKTDSSTPA